MTPGYIVVTKVWDDKPRTVVTVMTDPVQLRPMLLRIKRLKAALQAQSDGTEGVAA